MARPANKDILKRYRTEVERSKKWRKHEELDALWDRLVDLYRGRHYQKYVDEDRIVVNMAFATINVIAPSIAVNNPRIVVNARQEENADGGVIVEQVVNYHWRHQRFQKEIRRAVNDMLMIGHGWVKIGYSYAEPPAPATVADQDELDKETVPAHVDEPEGYPCAETLTPKRTDRPFVERVSFRDVFTDPDATTPTELRWICQRIRRPVADVKRDTRYTSAGRKEAQADTQERWSASDMTDAQNKGTVPGGYVDVYEFYDLVAAKVCTFTKHGDDDFLIAPKPIPLPFPNPFVMFRDYDVPDVFYPMGELEAIEVLQHELNETRTQQVNHRKRYNPKWLFRAELFPTQQAVDALADDTYNALVPVEGDIPSLQDSVVPMPTTTPPPELYNQSQIISNDMDMVTGVSDYMRGQMPEIRRTATEAAMLQDAQQSRAADKLAKIEATTSEIAERVIQVLQVFTTGDQVALVTGTNGIKLWFHYDRETIAGDYLFEVEAGSTQPMNESFRRQSALQMVDALGPFMEAGVINMPSMATYIINNGFGVKNAGHLVQLPPPPPEEMPAQGMGEPMLPAEAGGMPPPDGGGMPPGGGGMPPAEGGYGA